MADQNQTVITVGVEAPIYFSPMLERLSGKGVVHLNVPALEDLLRLLSDGAPAEKTAVLVYNAPGAGIALSVLRALGQGYEKVPVIVVVNEGSIDEYYELMSEGAYDYFGFVEGMTVIENAVRWAARNDVFTARGAAQRPPGRPGA